MKFSQLVKGTRAEKAVTFRYSGKDVATLLRPLSALEEVAIIAAATKAAQKDGVKEPKPGDAIYEAHIKAETIALTCLDPDSHPEARTATFDEGPKAVMEMDSDSISMLFEQQAMWQEECSPAVHTTSIKELWRQVVEVSERGDPFAYCALPLATRWLLQRFSSVLLTNSPVHKSWLSLISEDTNSDPKDLLERVLTEMAKTTTPATAATPAEQAPSP